ncbi:hypothetical protein D3C81_1061920 [compost metagenome]
MDLLAEIAPQVMGQTDIAGMTVPLPLAAGGIHRLVDRIDHLGDMDDSHITGKLIPASRPTDADHQVATAQLGEQLFEIGEGDTLALRDIRKRNRATLSMQRQIEHGGYGIAAFGGQSHGDFREKSLVWGKYVFFRVFKSTIRPIKILGINQRTARHFSRMHRPTHYCADLSSSVLTPAKSSSRRAGSSLAQ